MYTQQEKLAAMKMLVRLSNDGIYSHQFCNGLLDIIYS